VHLFSFQFLVRREFPVLGGQLSQGSSRLGSEPPLENFGDFSPGQRNDYLLAGYQSDDPWGPVMIVVRCEKQILESYIVGEDAWLAFYPDITIASAGADSLPLGKEKGLHGSSWAASCHHALCVYYFTHACSLL